MAKPKTRDGYTDQDTLDCERVLVTLLRGLGPWRESVFLVGGLTPRYLVRSRPPEVPPHAGTQDVDVVIELQILTDTQAYHTLEENLKNLGFERTTNERGQKLSWRWQTRTEKGTVMLLEFLADAPQIAGGKVQPLPIEGTISALNIPHASMVFDLHQITPITAELLNEGGIATVDVKHANLVSFTCLKAFAFDQRSERKDAHDLIYCLEHAEGGPGRAAAEFREALAGKHGAVILEAVAILRRRFTQEERIESFRKDGPVAVATFELGEGDEPELREARVLRQREVGDLIERLLADVGALGS
jgi:hypothetical protein